MARRVRGETDVSGIGRIHLDATFFNEGDVVGEWGPVRGTPPRRKRSAASERWVSNNELRAVGLRLGLGTKPTISNALRPLYLLAEQNILGLKKQGTLGGEWQLELASLEAALENPAFRSKLQDATGGGPRTAETVIQLLGHLRKELDRA